MKIKAKRRKLGLSQSQLARRVGCTRSHIANIENGHRRGEQYLPKIRKVLRA